MSHLLLHLHLFVLFLPLLVSITSPRTTPPASSSKPPCSYVAPSGFGGVGVDFSIFVVEVLVKGVFFKSWFSEDRYLRR